MEIWCLCSLMPQPQEEVLKCGCLGVKGWQYHAVLVYAISPLTAAIPVIWIKRRFGAYLAVWVLDLWPQSLSATGYVKNKLILKLVGFMVTWIYARTDTLLAQSRSFVRFPAALARRLYEPQDVFL